MLTGCVHSDANYSIRVRVRNMPKPRNDFIDRLQYLGLRLVSMLMHCWSVDLNLRWAQMLGNFMYAVDKRHRGRALANLRRSFPHMNERERHELARRSMQQLFMLFVEVLFTTRLVRTDNWRRYVELVNFRESLDLMLKRNQGLIML